MRIDPGAELGYLAQEMGDESRTIAELVAAARGALFDALAEMRRLEAEMAIWGTCSVVSTVTSPG